VGPTLAAPDLGLKDVALRAQTGQALLERAHPLPNLTHSPLELGIFERAQVFRHKPRR